MGKFICIHGHFYQPPRENPWLEAVEQQDSAFPYHDWNERICAECYAPNAFARLLDGEGRIERIISNYSRISFNFGPTLLSWLKEKMPEIHDAIVEADRASRQHFSGHGSAIAQCYGHAIMPLCNARDKYTQAFWGIRDFESRFGRKPEGMWLPETAADNPTLDVLARLGIKFTILSPYQASRVRPAADGEWLDVNGGKVDTTVPYLVRLPEGRSIAVFFYDGNIARAVAFERLLLNGEAFARRLTDAFGDAANSDKLVNVATDGESYGHHFAHGDMALAYALHQIENGGNARLTVYAEYLEKHPPTQEVEIHQPSAWSCSHGVGRWKRNCGCNSGGHGDWNQHWREPLREAFDWLRDQLEPLYEAGAKKFLKDPWGARNEYISVILDRSDDSIRAFFKAHAKGELNPEDQVSALRLLEMQRHALLMYTSCGWFFDELSGIETVQVIQYAARALQLADDLFESNLTPGFLEILSKAKSNISEHRDGRLIYEKFVVPAIMTRETAGAHYAISSLFQSYPETARVYSFSVKQEDRQLFTSGSTRLALGRVNITFEITRVATSLVYCVLHMGEHNLYCGVRGNGDDAAHAELLREAKAAFDRADFAEIIRLMDHHFGKNQYTLRNLFRDEQNRVLKQILANTTDEIHSAYRLIADRHAPLLRFLSEIHAPSLRALEIATELVLNNELRRQFENGHLDAERVRSLLAECAATKVPLDAGTLAYAFKGHLERLADSLVKTPEDQELLDTLVKSADLIPSLPFGVNLWKSQNACYQMQHTVLPEFRQRAAQNDEKAKAWLERFSALNEKLGVRVNGISTPAQP